MRYQSLAIVALSFVCALPAHSQGAQFGPADTDRDIQSRTEITISDDRTSSESVTASLDGTAKIWDVATGMEILSLPGLATGVQSVAFSRDGTRLIGRAGDGTVRIYVLRLDDLVRLARAPDAQLDTSGVYAIFAD